MPALPGLMPLSFDLQNTFLVHEGTGPCGVKLCAPGMGFDTSLTTSHSKACHPRHHPVFTRTHTRTLTAHSEQHTVFWATFLNSPHLPCDFLPDA